MPTISLLSDVLISQIAAGEVIQRPASIVKELVENAIDAQAKKIHILLKNGGIDEIMIKDDGCGIAKEQLKLAITRHATSKIISLDDLERVNTLGFRGEALASISCIAFLELISKPADQELAYQITPNPYQAYNQPQNQSQSQSEQDLDYQINAAPFSTSHGTEVYVKDIFFRTPARRKFLKSASAEALQCFEAIKRLALLHPDIEFSIEHGKQKLYFAPQSALGRAQQILGKPDDLKVLNHTSEDQKYTVLGFLTHPHHAKNRANEQHLIINQRWVRDKNLQFAIKQAYQQLTHGHGQNDYIIYLNLPNDEIDVNVHPEKTEVRLVHAKEMYRLLYHSVYQVLSLVQKPLNKALLMDLDSPLYLKQSLNQSLNHSAIHSVSQTALNINNQANQIFQQNNPENSLAELEALANSLSDQQNQQNQPSHKNKENDLHFTQQPLFLERPKWPYRPGLDQLDESADADQISSMQPASPSHLVQKSTEADTNPSLYYMPELDLGVAITIVDNIYLVAKNKEGLILVDIHAAHERILYENYKMRYQNLGRDEMPNFNVIAAPQRLLLAFEIELTPSQYLICEPQQSFFKYLGFEVDFYQKESIGYLNVISTPAIISSKQAPLVLYDLIEKLQAAEGDEQRLMHVQSSFENQWLSKLACHAALRAHDPLNLSQMDALLRMIETSLRSEYCNHGRPTWRLLSRQFLDHLFKHGQ